MNNRRTWTEEELRVLAAIYFKADFSLGDDARDECKTIATCFNRSAAAIDRQWRNLDAVYKGKSGLNIGKLVAEAVGGYLSHPAGFTQLAVRICESKGWPLTDLISQGYQSVDNRPIIESHDDNLQEALRYFVQGLEFKVFPSGAQGFYRNGIINCGKIEYTIQLSAIAIRTKSNRSAHVRTKSDHLAAALSSLIKNIRPKVFGTGRKGFHATGRTSVNLEVFQISIRAIQN